MKNSAKNQIELFLRVQQFGAANEADFPPDSFSRELFSQLPDIQAKIAEATAKMSTGSNAAASDRKKRTRSALREDVLAISRAGRTIQFERPETAVSFRIDGALNDQELLAKGRAFLTITEPFQAELKRRGLPDNFREDLLADITAFEQAIADRIVALQANTQMVRSIVDATAQGMDVVRKLDAMLRNTYRKNPGKLAAWKRASTMLRNNRPTSNEGTAAPAVAKTPEAA